MAKFHCIHCGQHIDAPDSMSGTQANCPSCQGAIQVPNLFASNEAIPEPPIISPNKKSKSSSSVTSVLGTLGTIFVLIVLGRACGSIVGRDAAQKQIERQRQETTNHNYSPNTSHADAIEHGLNEFVRLASPGLPKQIDRVTRLDSVSIEGGRSIVERYTLTGFSKREFEEMQLSQELRKMLVNDYRSNPRAKFLRDNNVRWIWRYYDKNGVYITEISSE